MEDNTGYLTLLMNFVAPVALGLMIAYAILRNRGISWRRRMQTERETKALYNEVDKQRERQQQEDRDR